MTSHEVITSYKGGVVVTFFIVLHLSACTNVLHPRHAMRCRLVHWAEMEAENNPKEKIT